MDVQIGIRVKEEMLSEIDRLAKEDRRNRSDFLRLVLEEALESRVKKEGVPA